MARAGLDGQVVHTARVDESKEGVAECLIFSFDFASGNGKIKNTLHIVKIALINSYKILYV